MDINFHGIQIFMDSMGPLSIKITKFYIHHSKVIRLCHENINPQNYLSFPKFKLSNLTTYRS